MPAAAVIPAPIAYIKVVAVKKLVVGSRDAFVWSHGFLGNVHLWVTSVGSFLVGGVCPR